MPELSKMHCVACSAEEPRVTPEQIDEYMPQIPDWEIVEVDGVPHLRRQFAFRNFADALAFTNRVGDAAEQEGHHPALLTEWGKVTASWWTHVLDGLHSNDFIMAAKTDALYDSGRRQ